jgi:hypothetical protein
VGGLLLVRAEGSELAVRGEDRLGAGDAQAADESARRTSGSSPWSQRPATVAFAPAGP